MKKTILFAIVSFTIFACVPKNNTSTNIENTNSENQDSYSFKTQNITITEADLVADLNNLRKKNNSLLLVNRVVYYKNNYPALFASAMLNNPDLQKALKWNTGIMAMMKKDVPFANFVNNASPTPSPSVTPSSTPSATPTPSSCPIGWIGVPPMCMPMAMPCIVPGVNNPPGCIG